MTLRDFIARHARLLLPLGITATLIWIGLLAYGAFHLAQGTIIPVAR